MKKDKKATTLLLILLPVIALTITSYFDNKANECYNQLGNMRYKVDVSSFQYANDVQQFQMAVSTFNGFFGNNSSTSAIKNNINNLTQYINYLSGEINNLSSTTQLRNLSALNPAPNNIAGTTMQRQLEEINQQLELLALSVTESSTALVINDSTNLTSLSGQENILSNACEDFSNLSTIFLYFSLALSVIIPIIKWGFIDKHNLD